MINIVFKSFFYRFMIASIIIYMTIFIDKFHILHFDTSIYMLFAITIFMILFHLHEDFGLVLAMIALLLSSYNMNQIQKHLQKENINV